MNGPNRDIEPEDFPNFSEKQKKLEFLIKLACLAPSSHNTQPWLFVIRDNELEVKIDKKRALSHSDPSNRQAYLSVGAALGNLVIASKAYGFDFDFTLSIQNDSVAKFTYKELNASNPDLETLKALVNRHSNRFPFENKQVPAAFWEKLKHIAGNKLVVNIFEDEASKNKLRLIVEDSVESAFKDKEFTNELSKWIKPSLRKYKDGMTGYYMGIPWIMSFIVPWIIRNKDVSKDQRKMHSEWLSRAPAYLILSTLEDNPSSWITAGMIFEHMAVEAEREQVKFGIFGAPIEIGKYHGKLQELTGTSARPVLFLRVGYTNKVPKFSPRLDLNQVLIHVN